jgi:hypothetical protein
MKGKQVAFDELDDRSMSQVSHESAMFRFVIAKVWPRVEQFVSTQISELAQYKGAQSSDSPTGETVVAAPTIEEMPHRNAFRLIGFVAGWNCHSTRTRGNCLNHKAN